MENIQSSCSLKHSTVKFTFTQEKYHVAIPIKAASSLHELSTGKQIAGLLFCHD